MKFSTPAERLAHLEDDEATKSNLQFAAVTAHGLLIQDIDSRKTDAMNYRESFRREGMALGADELEQARRLNEAVERKKLEIPVSNAAVTDATNRSAAAKDRLLECRRAIGGRKVEDFEAVAVEVEIPAGATIIETLGARIIELIGKTRRRNAVKGSRLPPEMVEEALIGEVDALAAQGGVQVSGLFGDAKRARIEWPLRKLNAEPSRLGNGDQPRVVDIEAMACRYLRGPIIAEIKTAVKEAYAGPAGDEVFTPEERQWALRALDAEIDNLERQVAELTWMAIDAGHDVGFHPGLPAKAILGIA